MSEDRQQSMSLRDQELGPTSGLARRALSMAVFPAAVDAGDHRQISRQEALALLAWADHYQLDPWAGHVCYMYSRPYVRVEGALAHARRQPGYRGYSVSYVDSERKRAMGYEDGDLVCECYVEQLGQDQAVREYGVVTRAERDLAVLQITTNVERDLSGKGRTQGELELEVMRRKLTLPILRNPSLQAHNRAIRRAHLRAYPLDGYTPDEPTTPPESGG